MTDSEDKNGADKGAEEAKEEVIEAMARSAEIYGLNQSYGRIYGEIYFADEALSLDEVSDRSGYAKSTVSKVMNTLEDFHMVRRKTTAESGKKVYFEAERDFWYVIQEMLQNQGRREIRVMKRALKDAEDKLEGSEAETELERVQDLKEMYEELEVMVNAFTMMSKDEIMQMKEFFEEGGGNW